MALNPLIAQLQTATRCLEDVAEWTSDGLTTDLRGVFDPGMSTEPGMRDPVFRPTFRILTADAEYIGEGDTLYLNDIDYDIVKVEPTRMGETMLTLRVAR